MDLTNQLGLMRALPQRCSVIASSDRMLISAIAQLFDGVGPLVGAATSEAAALQCLCSGGIELLVCTDQLDQGSGPALVAAAKQRHPIDPLPDADPASAAQHHRGGPAGRV